jgi:hypothetical protein
MFRRAYSRPPVKPARTTPHKPGRFGAGILAWTPAYPETHSAEDEAWYVANVSARESEAYDRMLAEAEIEWEAQRRAELGCYVY